MAAMVLHVASAVGVGNPSTELPSNESHPWRLIQSLETLFLAGILPNCEAGMALRNPIHSVMYVNVLRLCVFCLQLLCSHSCPKKIAEAHPRTAFASRW